MLIICCFLTLILPVYGWPDGAPCVHAAFESMNPLEAVEHQGGLQLSPPPFTIDVKQTCYWINQPVELTLRGNTTTTKFKGFAIQPFVYEGANAGTRVGQFLRLDDNGSWQQQCFKRKDSVTHSHDEKKEKITLWWKSDREDSATIQFVASVVVALRQFWVKSVVSAPIPPCKKAEKIGSWQPQSPTVPPPVGQFKSETFRMFNQQSSGFILNSIANPRPVPRPAPTFSTPSPMLRQNLVVPQQRQRLTHVIPLPQMETNPRPRQFNSQQGTSQCFDREPMNRCLSWLNFCQTSNFMRSSCRQSCRLC